MPVNFIRSLTHKHRTPKANTRLGITLAFVAGGINAGGFLAIGYYTSHMTGIVSGIADAVALHQWKMAALALGFLCSFVAGSLLSCFVIQVARTRNLTSEFAFALMLEAVLLMMFGLTVTNFLHMQYAVPVTIMLLCFIMGLQNALITKISHAEIRTTHVTGICTDIGIELGRKLYSKLGSPIASHADKLLLHTALLVAFLIGGIAGAFSFKYMGFVMTVPFALVLACMAIIPIMDDVRARRS